MPPYNNKTRYDPGRFRHKVDFVKRVSTKTPSGGSTVGYENVFSTRAVRELIREGSQISIITGASIINQDAIFIIRLRSGTPTKAMEVIESGYRYTIAAIIPIDDPANYYRIVAIRQDIYTT